MDPSCLSEGGGELHPGAGVHPTAGPHSQTNNPPHSVAQSRSQRAQTHADGGGVANYTQEDLRWDSNPQPPHQFLTESTKAI